MLLKWAVLGSGLPMNSGWCHGLCSAARTQTLDEYRALEYRSLPVTDPRPPLVRGRRGGGPYGCEVLSLPGLVSFSASLRNRVSGSVSSWIA